MWKQSKENMFSKWDYVVLPSPEENSFLTKTGNEWDPTGTRLVSGTPASWVATPCCVTVRRKLKGPGGIDPFWVQVQDAPQCIWEKQVVLICSVGMLNLH